MNNTIVFLRHAKTQKDPSINAELWSLSANGKLQAKTVANELSKYLVDKVYASEELKSIQTAQEVVRNSHLEINTSSAFNEVKRGDKYLSDKDFEREKQLQLEDLTYAAFNGETGFDALERFKKGVNTINNLEDNKTILIVTHGTILNIYFADLLGKGDELVKRWERTNFCGYGITKNNKIIRDIVS